MWSLLLSVALAVTCPASIASVEGLVADDPRFEHTVVVVDKDARRLGVYKGGALVEGGCWQVALAAGYVPGHKQRRGDLRTPEGWYRISDRPWSQYYSALTVHYPGDRDAERGLEAGLVTQAEHDAIVAAAKKRHIPPRTTRLGGDIVIHGGGGRTDWTLGCVGMEDDEIDALRARLPEDKRGWVVILP